MALLAAVRPNWLGIGNGKSGAWEGSIRVVCGDRYAAIFVSRGMFHITRGLTIQSQSLAGGPGMDLRKWTE